MHCKIPGDPLMPFLLVHCHGTRMTSLQPLSPCFFIIFLISVSPSGKSFFYIQITKGPLATCFSIRAVFSSLIICPGSVSPLGCKFQGAQIETVLFNNIIPVPGRISDSGWAFNKHSEINESPSDGWEIKMAHPELNQAKIEALNSKGWHPWTQV